jgi:hypothetical protein
MKELWLVGLALATAVCGQTPYFQLQSPAASDTFYVGDTMQVRYEHGSAVQSVISKVSFDGGEYYYELAHVGYGPFDSVVILHCWDYGQCLVGMVNVAHPTDSTVLGGWDWAIPHGGSPPPDTGLLGTFSFGDCGSTVLDVQEERFRLLARSSAEAPKEQRLPQGPLRPYAVCAYDLCGRRIADVRVSWQRRTSVERQGRGTLLVSGLGRSVRVVSHFASDK